jgi:hypothetical protein
MRRVAVIGIIVLVIGALAPGLGARAAQVEHGTGEWEYTYACGWWQSQRQDGSSEHVWVCGWIDAGQYSSTWVDPLSGERPPVGSGSATYPREYSLGAGRWVCDADGNCHEDAFFWASGLSAEQVSVNTEKGTAELKGQLTGADDAGSTCDVDVTISAPTEQRYHSTLPSWHGSYYPLTNVWTGLFWHEGASADGTATGSACGWTEAMQVPGQGHISRHSSQGGDLWISGGL